MKEFDLFQEQPSLPLEEAAKNEVPDGEPPLLAKEDAPEEEAASPEEESCPEEAAFDQGQGAEEPPCPPECPAGPSLQEVLEAQKQLLQKVEELQALFQSRILHTDHEEKIVDQMHHELQKHREGLYAQLVRPILLDVIQVRDSIRRMAAVYLERPAGQQDIPNKIFAGYALDLQDILERNEVEVYDTAPGEPFAPLRQRVVKKVPTGEEELHGKVAASLSDGYSYNGRTLSPEKVAVYTYEKPVQETEKSEKSEGMNNG